MRFARHKVLQIERLEVSHIDKVAIVPCLIRQRGHESGGGEEIVDDMDLGGISEQWSQFGSAVAEEPYRVESEEWRVKSEE